MSIESNSSRNRCPECGGFSIISRQERGEKVCRICGLVIEERIIDTSVSGQRYFTQEERNKKKHTGPLISTYSSSLELSPKINLSEARNWDQRRILAKNPRVKDYKNRHLSDAFSHLTRICNSLRLKKIIIEQTKGLYLQAKHLAQGRTVLGLVCACLFYICKINNIPITFKELAENITGLIENPLKKVKKCYLILFKELNLPSPRVSPYSFISCFISDLGQTNIIGFTTQLITLYLSKVGCKGTDPKGICAAGIYLACIRLNIKCTQREISKIAQISEVTLRSRLKKFQKVIKESEFLKISNEHKNL